MGPPIRYELRDEVARIALDDPSNGNALDRKMLVALEQALAAARADPSCRVIVISSTGPDFCRGLDLDAFEAGRGIERADLETFAASMRLICFARCPVVACVDGEAAGGGVGLAGAADIVIASKRARFILPEVIFGLIPGLVAPILARRMSHGRLRAFALGSTGADAFEAQRIGLVDEVADGGIEEALAARVRRLLRSSQPALEATKRWLDEIENRRLDQLIDTAVERAAAWMARPEVIEAIALGRKA
jgi:enoyl-CoA hydratase/carnithine racemase